MSRYIDADLIEKELTENGFYELDKIPTADVVPVKHGHWINSGYACGETDWECSVCHCHEWRTSKTEYCMRCGAKMDDSTQSNDSNTLDALDALGEKVTE